jgi:hypothetical protein
MAILSQEAAPNEAAVDSAAVAVAVVSTEAQDKCLRLFVVTAARNVKFLSNQAMTNQFIAGIVTRNANSAMKQNLDSKKKNLLKANQKNQTSN